MTPPEAPDRSGDLAGGAGTVLLRGGGVCLLLDVSGRGQPEIAYWGADLGEVGDAAREAAVRAWRRGTPSSGPDEPLRIGLLPEADAGYRLAPGLQAQRGQVPVHSRLRPVALASDARAGTFTCTTRDGYAGIDITSAVHLDEHGVLTVHHAVRNIGAEPLDVVALRVTLPLPGDAQQILDFTGRWSKERVEQRHPVRFGSWLRQSRRGRPGPGSAYLTMVGAADVAYRRGPVWAAHLAWSGNHEIRVEADPDGSRVLSLGELLEPGEITLGPGEQYAAPPVLATFSPEGIDGISNRMHRHIRARPAHPRTPRPVVLNTWEAVYFDHDLDRLRELADVAADIGVERFVLDDGWFGSRRNDRAGLGDWVESAEVWPDGLGPIVRHVHSLGMQFGLWVEPEMVNPDSDLYRAHPDWVLADPERLPPLARCQYVLDVARPEVAEYLFEHLDALVTRHSIAFLKWDHNRDAVMAVHGSRAGVHAQTLAVYALLDRLRAAHPGLEIESCASGGARIDLGILARTDRVWASDCNDALERQQIQRGTRTLIPLELIGAHVGPTTSHTTGRVHGLEFRLATALFGHFGIEWDISRLPAEDRATLAAGIAQYRRLRPLLHSGDLVTADGMDPATELFGVVAPDLSHAVYSYVQLTASTFETVPPARLPGLAADRDYAVRLLSPDGAWRTRDFARPPWLHEDEIVTAGSVLARLGLAMPALEPEQALLMEVTARD